MRITFLNLKDYRHQHSLVSGPIGLAYLAGAAKHRFPGIHVQIEVDVDQVIASKPDIIGVSAYTEDYSQSIEAARYLRRKLPGTPIWLGGPHINALPNTLARDFDLGVVGEGEETFVELLELYDRNQLDPDHLKAVNGIVYWDNDERVLTPERDVIQDLDQIILPDRSVMKTYWPPSQSVLHWPQPIYTSRGCPFKCVFCIFSMDSQKVRYHSVERVVAEIEDILRHHPGQQHITIHDDLFALSKKRLAALTAGIREAGIHKKVSFVCMAKASIFNDDMARLMRDMNVSVVTFGLESGVERILKYLKGERNKVEHNVNAIEVCARHGIRMGGYFIIGTPHETYHELQDAYWFIRNHLPPMVMAGIYRLTPFPGTKFWQEAVEMGLVSNDMEDWRPFNYLNQDKRDFLFFNKHYSLETFNQAYPHFVRLTDRNHLGMGTEKQELTIKEYLEPLMRETLLRFKPERTLEVSGFSRMLAEWLAEEEGLTGKVDLLRPWEFDRFANPESLANSDHSGHSALVEPAADPEFSTLSEAPKPSQPAYDLIIVNLALEQIAAKPELVLARLSEVLAPGGRMLLICYNPLNSSMLSQLLAGRWFSDFWGMRPFDMLRYFGPKQLENLLPLEVAERGRLEIPSQGSPLSTEVLELLGQITPVGLAGLNDMAYTVLTTPKEAQGGQYLQAADKSGARRDFAIHPS